jgi:hypothetical protein
VYRRFNVILLQCFLLSCTNETSVRLKISLHNKNTAFAVRRILMSCK